MKTEGGYYHANARSQDGEAHLPGLPPFDRMTAREQEIADGYWQLAKDQEQFWSRLGWGLALVTIVGHVLYCHVPRSTP